MAILIHKRRVALADTDAAGLLYFVSQLQYAHEAYELLMVEIGLPLRQIIASESFLLPLVHLESDYLARLEVGDEIEVRTAVEKIGETSFVLSHQLFKADSLVGEAETVHVALDKRSRGKVSLPDRLRQGLENFRETS
ncbi:MAG: thioesterase family protein [bacterium]